MQIFLMMYIDAHEDYSKKFRFVEEAMKKSFSGGCELEYQERINRVEDNGNIKNSQSLVFSIRKPVVKDPEIIEEFFTSLRHVLHVLSDFSPHFTQEIPRTETHRIKS